jgi:hypothetical protein
LEADGITANFPVTAGPGGSIRSDWFTDQMSYDFLDNLMTSDRDATGSTPNRLITWAAPWNVSTTYSAT